MNHAGGDARAQTVAAHMVRWERTQSILGKRGGGVKSCFMSHASCLMLHVSPLPFVDPLQMKRARR